MGERGFTVTQTNPKAVAPPPPMRPIEIPPDATLYVVRTRTGSRDYSGMDELNELMRNGWTPKFATSLGNCVEYILEREL